jgi:nucleotide-binding universal stress UspA family protein
MSTSQPTWLVPHDFSACADAAADLALKDLRAQSSGGRIVLVHVVSLFLPPGVLEAGFVVDIVGMERAACEDANSRLAAIAARLRATAPARGASSGTSSVTIDVVTRLGTPAESILDECAAQGAERIVIGTHGRRGVPHLLLGSVAARLARRAQVPVLIAHAAPTSQPDATTTAAQERA